MPPAGSIIHGHSTLTGSPHRISLTAFGVATRVKRLRWVETVHHGNQRAIYESWSRSRQTLYAQTLTRARVVLAIGSELAEFLIDIGIPKQSVVVTSPLLPWLDSVDGVLSRAVETILGTCKPVLVTVGAMTPDYDFLTIARAFQRLSGQYPDLGLVIVSSSFARDPGYYWSVQRAVEGAESRVAFVEDLDRAQMGALLARADVLIRGPRRESFGLVRVEALLRDTRVVATNTGETSFVAIYDHGDPASLERTTSMVLKDESPIPSGRIRGHFMAVAEQSFRSVLDAYTRALSD